MKSLLHLIIFIPISLLAQVGINTTNPKGMLDVESSNNGILIPRVQLTSILDNTTIVNPNTGPLETSTLVYNTTAAGTIPNNVVPGFYYWNANVVPPQWVPISGNRGWNTNGNSDIISPSTPTNYGVTPILANENFIGTNSNSDFVVATNSIERLRVDGNTGNIGIGVTEPIQPLHIYKNSNANKSSIYAHAAQTSVSTNYLNIGVQGHGSGTSQNGGFGYGVGILGIGNTTNSYRATGVYAHLGTNTPNGINTSQALYANGNNLGNAAEFVNGNVIVTGGNTNLNGGVLNVNGGNAIINTGRVGIGTTAPTTSLHINSTTNGAFRLVDGTQANGRILTSNANGVATWQRPGIENIVGVLDPNGISIPYNLTTYRQTGSRITLPPGRYAVNVTMLLARNTTPAMSPNNSFFWVRSSFSELNTANPPISPDIVGSNLASGNFPGTSQYAMLTGTIIINNTSTVNKTYYYIAGNCVYSNTNETLTNFGSTIWQENNIIAYRLN